MIRFGVWVGGACVAALAGGHVALGLIFWWTVLCGAEALIAARTRRSHPPDDS